MEPVTASQLVADRPPDRVAFGPWEPDFENERKLPKRLVATQWTLLTVLEYTEIEEVHTPLRRKRMEFWETELGTVGRWEWEYRP